MAGSASGAIAFATDPTAIADEWDALADELCASPWLRPGWVQAWWRAFGRGRLEVIAVRRNGRLSAVLPVRRRRGAVLSPTNWHSPGFGILAVDAEGRSALLRHVWGLRPRSVALHLLDASSGDVEACTASAAEAGYRVMRRVELRSPYVPTTGSLDAYVSDQPQGRKILKELRRQRRRLEQQHGPLKLRLESGETRLDDLFQSALALEGSGWKPRQGSDIASRPETRRFYEDVASWSARRGTLRLAFLDAGDRPIACRFLLDEHGSLFDLKGGYDQDFRPFGPGNILLQEMLAHAFGRETVKSFELLGTEEPYKLQWTERVRERVLFQAFAPTPTGRIEALAFSHGRPLAKRALGTLQRWRGH